MRYMLHALNVLRIDVPGKIALAGFDDFDIADVLHPALTVIRQPVYQIGETGANLLFERISRGEYREAVRYMKHCNKPSRRSSSVVYGS